MTHEPADAGVEEQRERMIRVGVLEPVGVDRSRAALEGGPDIGVVGSAVDVETLRAVVQGEPDVVFVDLGDRGQAGDAAEELARVRELFPAAVLVTVSDLGDIDAVFAAAAAGATGILVRDPEEADLLAAIRAVSNGVVVIDRGFVSMLGGSLWSAPAAGTPDRRVLSPLTTRETEVLSMLSRGSRVASISEDLQLSAHTVRSHVKSILTKLGCHSQVEAVVKAASLGWLPEAIARPPV